MKIKIFLLMILIPAIFIIPSFAEVKCRIDGEQLILNYKNTEYKTSVSGNAVMNQFQKGGSVFFEVHVNPSLSELIVFNLKTKKFTSYPCTQYFINDRLDILTVVDPPHFSPEESGIKREIYVNGRSVYKPGKSAELDVKISSREFDIYSDGKKIGYVKKNKTSWVFHKI